MRVIHLTHGEGNGIDKACLMTATNMLRGRGEKSDASDSCVCVLLRQFIVITNDLIPEDQLGKYYGDLPWEIIGTYTEDLDVLVHRAQHMALFANKFAEYAAKVAAESAEYAEYAAKYAAAKVAAESAEYAANAANIYKMCVDCILEVASIGDCRPKEHQCVMTREDLCDALS